MKDYILKDEWNIIEKGFIPEYNRISESIFSIGNGHMGQRANFEEKYSGESMQGSYLAGVYYPDKTRVGWWKNGYPKYFAKVVNSINWIGINITIESEELDLATCKIHSFERRLNMKEGILSRKVEFTHTTGKRFLLESSRFTSLSQPDAGLIKYQITPLESDADIEVELYLDGNVHNEDSNYDETFWREINKYADEQVISVAMKTRKTGYHVCAAAVNEVKNGKKSWSCLSVEQREGFVSQKYAGTITKGANLCLTKYVAIQVSLNHDKKELNSLAQNKAQTLAEKGFEFLYKQHVNKWAEKWAESDIIIDGDISAQQAIRYNVFQLYQTYTGDDPRLNIGPKGFTGEKYGGVTYWDTEAYCLPFYLRTADQSVARNLLRYRYNHLQKAIENAEKLGFNSGAALYPMVTINGEECHNEWEITFEEIHRNGAVAYAIFNYINYTDDTSVIAEFGLEVLIAISRFWSQRATYSEQKNAFVILGVTGPNEYENNVNNNWYTNTVAHWTLRYTLEQIAQLKTSNSAELDRILGKVNLSNQETDHWRNLIEKFYFPYDEQREIFLQQDGFLDKELIPAAELSTSERPIHKKWSWDRILRSCYIKQADVLQGIYMFEDQYDVETIRKNYKFYEPLTVHESSLSASIHAILACSIGDYDKAYEMYLRTARLDLDDYNDDSNDGLHITSMGGTWMSIVEGFAGLRVREHILSLNPSLPAAWNAYTFRIVYRGVVLKINISRQGTTIENSADSDLDVDIAGTKILIPAGRSATHIQPWQQVVTA